MILFSIFSEFSNMETWLSVKSFNEYACKRKIHNKKAKWLEKDYFRAIEIKWVRGGKEEKFYFLTWHVGKLWLLCQIKVCKIIQFIGLGCIGNTFPPLMEYNFINFFNIL